MRRASVCNTKSAFCKFPNRDFTKRRFRIVAHGNVWHNINPHLQLFELILKSAVFVASWVCLIKYMNEKNIARKSAFETLCKLTFLVLFRANHCILRDQLMAPSYRKGFLATKLTGVP